MGEKKELQRKRKEGREKEGKGRRERRGKDEKEGTRQRVTNEGTGKKSTKR